MNKIKKGDLVVVTTGKDEIKNKTGKILSVDRSNGRVLILTYSLTDSIITQDF